MSAPDRSVGSAADPTAAGGPSMSHPEAHTGVPAATRANASQEDLQIIPDAAEHPRHAAQARHTWVPLRKLAAPRAWLPLLPERLRQVRRPRLWQEIAFIVLSYWVYSLIRDAVPIHERPALLHARSVFNAEKSLDINVEHSVNHFFDTVHWGGWHYLANISDYYYAVMHFVVVVGVLIWVYVRRPLNYRSTRTVLYATNGLAAIVFWLYPLAPPRLLPGERFVDTVVKYHTWGSWGSNSVSKISNQYAAMPSLHIGWSLWAGITVFMLVRQWWLRTIALLYPLLTFLVIIGTANHFVLDAAGGIIVLAGGYLIQYLLTGRHAYATVDGARDDSSVSASGAAQLPS